MLEVLVSTGIIAILLSLSLPAVQSMRETSRRAQCVANLRQLAVATEAFVSTNGEYPGIQRVRGNNRFPSIPPGPLLPPGPNESIHARLLPFLDQSPLYQKLDPLNDGYELGEPLSAEQNDFALEADVAVFTCPSDRVPVGGNSYRGCLGPTTGKHATWARGMPLEGTVDMEGLFGVFQTELRPQKVRDGQSHTVLFSERVVGDGDPEHYSLFRDLAGLGEGHFYRPNEAVAACASFSTPDRHYSFLGHTWVLPDYAHTVYNHVLAPNSRIPDCQDSASERFAQGAMTARSLHPGGVNAVLADGAVRLFSESIDLKVWRALGSINGGEVFDDF